MVKDKSDRERGCDEEASAGGYHGMSKACPTSPVLNPSRAPGSDGSWVPLTPPDGLRRIAMATPYFVALSMVLFTVI